MTRRNRGSRGGRPNGAATEQALEHLLLTASSPFATWHVREPSVVCGDQRPAPDPKTGLALFGPWGTADDPPLSQVRLGVVGTGQTIQLAQSWITRCRTSVQAGADPTLFPPFPGTAARDGFQCDFEAPVSLVEPLTAAEVAQITNAPDRDAAVEAAATAIGAHLRALADRDSPPQVVLVVLPDEIRTVAGGGRRKTTAPRRRAAGENQLTLSFMDPRPLEPFRRSRTLHRAIKAEGMRVDLPTQLIWETTLTGADGVQDEATCAWNLSTALYYKAGGVPWRVSGLPRNTCYIGLSFYRAITAPNELQTSMAQAFSDRGDGIVLRGASFHWDSRQQGPPCLSREDIRNLIAEVLTNYERHHARPPARVVVHKSARFSEDEKLGLQDALDSAVPYYDCVSITPSKIRFLRAGEEPPVRGTVVQVARGRYVVFTRGYVPFLKLYPGLRIPHPYQIVHEGTSSVTDLVGEILGLTRMNYNSADFASAEPITIAFSRNVGLILSELPDDILPKTSFRFYM